MRFATLSGLVVLGAAIGLSGCVNGSVDDEPDAGSSGNGSGGQMTGSGNTGNNSGNTSTVGGAPGAAGSGNSAAGSSNMTPGGGAVNGGSGNTSGGTPPSGGNGSGGSGGTPSNPTKDCKRGIGWHGSALTNAEVTSKITWWYTWGLGVQNVGAGLEFTPMVWGGGAKLADVTKALRPDAQYLLGYNEPNFFEQADLSAQEAAAEWPTIAAAAASRQLKTVSPAVNFCGNDAEGTGPCHDTNPVDYLKDFFAACSGCQVDYVAVHWYNCDGNSLNRYLDQFKQFGRPVWLTEFACAYEGDTSVAGQEKYMREAIPILEQRPDIYRYAWFSGDPMPNARLLNADGSLTSLGKVYVDLPHDPTCTP